jgi:hypothetical protein
MARKLTRSRTIPRSAEYRTRNAMENFNAFINHAAQPTPEELATALGPTATIWNKLVGCLADEYGLNVQEWNSYSLKAGWSMRLKLKKRNILYMSPCKDCFRVAFILGDKAVQAARQIKLPQPILKAIDDAPHYPEGTGVRLIVKRMSDLPAIRKLAEVKLAN